MLCNTNRCDKIVAVKRLQRNGDSCMELKKVTDIVEMFTGENSKQKAKDFEILLKNGNKFQKLMAYYKCAIMEVETKFKVLNESLSLRYDHNPIETIKTRLKDPKSIIDKVIRKGMDCTWTTIEKEMNDIAGIRVVCTFIEDVYMVAEYLMKQDDITLVEYKDYIKSPKENGYRSLHVIVSIPIFLANEKRMMKVEVQFRTMAMDFWASLEHKLRYKKDLECTEEIEKELKECAETSAKLDEKMQYIKNKIEG